MDKNNLNERIAEWKDGIVFEQYCCEEQKEFHKHRGFFCWRDSRDGQQASYCKFCQSEDNPYVSRRKVTDYTADSEWGKVVAKLKAEVRISYCTEENAWQCRILKHDYTCFDTLWGKAYPTTGEALCRALVAYLDATKEGK